MRTAQMLSIWLNCFLCFTLVLQGEEIAVRTPEGSYLVVEVPRDEPFCQVIERLGTFFDSTDDGKSNPSFDDKIAAQFTERDFWLDFKVRNPSPKAVPKSTAAQPRSYPAGLSPQEQSDIEYILTTLAKNSTLKILKYKSSLEKAGERLDRVHPLRFLQCILVSEELKTALRVIRQKSLIWKDFFKGIKTSLSEEAGLNNLLKEYIDDFAASLHLNPNLLYSSLAEHQWADFVDLLIKLVPRSGNTERYDM